jgi:Na+/melibiose symporter-like transporter
MNKKQLALSLIPIIGLLMYLIPIFIQSIHTKNLTNWKKALASFFLGMLSFIVIYGGFALLSNLSNLNLESNMWLLYIMLYLSFVIWNFVFFLSYNRIIRKSA